jgi:ribosomal protein S18 acetylase RimI-like enzyme
VDDVPALAAIERLSFGARDAFSPRTLRHLITRAKAVTVVAESIPARRPLAYATALLRSAPARPASARLYSVAVHPMARGQGLARKLLNRLLRRLASLHVARVSLEVEATNTPAVALYKSLGFVTDKHLPHYYARRRHGLRMVRASRFQTPHRGIETLRDGSRT